LEALIDYLEDILRHRGHFNIDDELAVGNINKYELSVNNIIKSKPFLNSEESSQVDSEPTDESMDTLNEREVIFNSKVHKEKMLLDSYNNLWKSEFRDNVKSVKGGKRQLIHRELFLDRIATVLKSRNLEFVINEELNICYMKNANISFPNTFIKIIETIETIDYKNQSLFYRGHDDSSYRLIPSIYRGNASFYEKELLYDTINLLPEEVSSALSNFEVLTKLQHFGTPTRLLDITTNPLVALYFSCINDTHNGEVLCFSVPKEKVKLFDSDTISILSNLSKMPFNFDIKKISGLDTKSFNNQKQIKELVHKIRSEKGYFDNIIDAKDLLKSFFVISKLDNPRIIRQSGAFIICGMDSMKILPSPEIFDFEKEVAKRIIISKSLKKDILKSLDKFNISSGSLFPDLSEVSRYIKRKYSL
jgi:hypothetical protein